MLTLFFTISISLMILLPVLFASAVRRRFQVPWLLFCAGILTFTAAQVVHIPLNHWLTNLGLLTQPGQPGSRPLWLTALVLGLTAGLCEELARAGGYALLRRFRNFGDGLMFGLGHGGIEAMVLGGVLTAASVGALLPLQHTDLNSLPLSAEQIAALKLQIQTLLVSPWLAFVPLIERILAMGLHVTFSLIVLRAFQKRNVLYVLLAILYHMAVDAIAVVASQTYTNAWVIEGIVFLTALPGYLWLAWLFRREGATTLTGNPPVRRDLSVFWTAFRKEMLQQWRTRRVLIVAAVFVLFGMGSPLLAYFTPQMLKAIPGAEQFSSLVPTPTAADAMQQYVKNLTQFGFILALLLGMGEVAGEKERGTASLVLSKPMTRSAFVASKLASQVAVYLLGFLLAMVGAYYYTLVLFGDLQLGPFALLNLALVFWLLPYVAVTLLGSVIGNTTGAAAGIGLVGMVVLLIASGIPQISPVMPSALAGWAGQLGSQAAGGLTPGVGGTTAALSGPATGALAACFVIALICLITSIAVFEQQEL